MTTRVTRSRLERTARNTNSSLVLSLATALSRYLASLASLSSTFSSFRREVLIELERTQKSKSFLWQITRLSRVVLSYFIDKLRCFDYSRDENNAKSRGERRSLFESWDRSMFISISVSWIFKTTYNWICCLANVFQQIPHFAINVFNLICIVETLSTTRVDTRLRLVHCVPRQIIRSTVFRLSKLKLYTASAIADESLTPIFYRPVSSFCSI